jgi:Glycosyl hydrolases family 16
MSGRPADNIDGFGLDEPRHHGGVADGVETWAAVKPGAGRGAKGSLSRRLLVVAVATVLVVTLTVWGTALTRHTSSNSVAARLTAKSAARAGTTAPDAGARSELPAGTFFALPSTTVPITTVPIAAVPITVGATGAGSPQVSGGGGAPLSASWVQGTVPGTIAADAGSRPEPSAGTVSPAASPTPTKTPSAAPTKAAASQPASSGPSAAPSGGTPAGGTPSGGTPSGGGVPGNVPGWQLTYSTAFPGDSLPSKWGAYSGQPGGDPDGNWAPANVAVSGGELHFYANNGSTGGVDFFGNPQTDGMYLVRMKGDYEPGINISDILLLWPDSNVWPPEIDFFEDSGGARSGYQATVHLGPNGDNSNQVHVNVSNDATQWHTYGVQWTASTITFTVDGQSVGSVSQRDTSSWPDIAMNLDLQSQNLGPSQPANGTETMTVAWVAEYAMS